MTSALSCRQIKRRLQYQGIHLTEFTPARGARVERILGRKPSEVCRRRSLLVRASLGHEGERDKRMTVRSESDDGCYLLLWTCIRQSAEQYCVLWSVISVVCDISSEQVRTSCRYRKLHKMHATSFVPLLIYSLIGSSLALKIPHEPHYGDISRRCEARNVYFHYNNTALGTMASCSWDVMSFAAAAPPIAAEGTTAPPPSLNRPREGIISPRQSCPPGSCTNGPTTNYTVQPNDSLEKIAATFDSGVCDITKLNHLASPDFVLDGQQLIVPTKLCQPDNTSCRTPPGTRPCIPWNEGISPKLRIKSGDTFFLIGVRLNITADSIVAVNLCVDPGALEVGQVVNIPICPKCYNSGCEK